MSSHNDSRRIKILEEMAKVIYREWSLKLEDYSFFHSTSSICF